jgi:hypothetical protein
MSPTLDLLRLRLDLGKVRYGHGLLHPSNENMNFRHELVEELLDAVVYAAADVVRKNPPVSVVLSPSGSSARLDLTVNWDPADDGTEAIHDAIAYHSTRKHDYRDTTTEAETVLLLCLFSLEAVLKYN